jgi:glycosyltransferase involved in cell wall biosynthesis
LKILKEKQDNANRKGWLVVGSTSWIKGTNAGIEWCEKNEKEYKIIHNWSYEKVLEELNQAEGLVYLPLGGDTCPRLVIEAKLLGCKLELNVNVQHKDEEWFKSDDPFDTEAYLYAAREKFWNSVAHSMSWVPSISGYTTTKNCIESKYPWKECIQSMLEFCNEVVVVDGGSTDGTYEALQSWATEEERLNVYLVKRDWNAKRFAVFDGLQKGAARAKCRGDFCWQMDADEIVHEGDYEKIKTLVKTFPRQADLVSLPVVEYWGGGEKIRLDVNPWKWRLSRNVTHITHGIPSELRKFDADGNLYAKAGTDGCDYVHSETYERIPHASFYSEEIHKLRVAALRGDPEALTSYKRWFTSLIDGLPGVHHYSWYDIKRKINTYKNYWQKHWESLYDIKQEDTPDNNMFFEKRWVDVTEEEIEKMSLKLSDEMGGWIFHSRVDFDNPTPHIEIDRQEPQIMLTSK